MATGTTATDDLEATFAPFARRMAGDGLAPIVIDNFRYYYGQLAAGDTGLIAESTIEPIERVTDITQLAPYHRAGLSSLDRVAMLKLNGGLGTSMGLDRAKSLLEVRDGLTFLDIIARQLIAFNQRHRSRVPLLLMNSFNTDADSRAVLANYPELEGDLPLVLLQNKVPKILRDSLAPAECPQQPELEWCPPGHGEVYVALATTGLLDRLLAHGIEYLFLSNADNLGATLDPAILGYLVERKLPFLMEVTDRTEADKKGGHLARRDGMLILREIAQCPEADLEQFQDIQRHRYFNTNNIWVNLPQLQRLLDRYENVLKLPMIRNAKPLDPRDEASPGVYQLETAMGAAIGVFEGADALRVTRERFIPVKLCSDLLALRSDAYLLDEQFHLQMAPERAQQPLTIELDNAFYKQIAEFEARFARGVPSLVACRKLTVIGDVAFGADVVCAGEVIVINDAATQHTVQSGTRLENVTYKL